MRRVLSLKSLLRTCLSWRARYFCARRCVAAPVVGLGAATGAGVAGALGSYSLMAPESFAGIYEETGTLAPGAASIAGAINSALELVAPAQLLRSFSPSMRTGVVTAVLKKSGMQPSIAANAAKGVVKGVVTEGTTEGTQEAVNIAAEKFVGDNPMIFDSEDFKRIAESTVAGAAVGFPLGGIGGAGRGFTDRGQFRRDKIEAERLAAEQAEPVIEEPVVAEEAASVTEEPVVAEEAAPEAAQGAAVPAVPADGIPEPTVVGKKPPVVEEAATVTGADETVIDEELATRGFQKTETQEEVTAAAEEDIPESKPLWSKDLLGFVTGEYDITEAEVAGFTQTQMDRLLADAEANGAVFDGEMIVPEQTAQQAAPAAAEQTAAAEQEIDDGIGQLKDPEKALLVYQELGVNEQEGFDLTDEDFDALVREAERQRSLRKPVVGESTAPESTAPESTAPEAAELSDEELNTC